MTARTDSPAAVAPWSEAPGLKDLLVLPWPETPPASAWTGIRSGLLLPPGIGTGVVSVRYSDGGVLMVNASLYTSLLGLPVTFLPAQIEALIEAGCLRPARMAPMTSSVSR